jgi:flagellar basal body P-ring formation protein FlgA
MELASVMPMNTPVRLRDWFPTLLLLAASGAWGQSPPVQPLDELRRAAEALLAERLHSAGSSEAVPHVTAGALDSRLRLQRCTGKLEGVMPPTATVTSRMTVGLRCASPAWTVYVPMTVETELKVLVMRQAAARNSTPVAADVELQLRRVPGIATGYLTRIEQLQGQHLKVAVSPGTALSTELLAADILIKRGQRVTLVAAAGGIEVLAQGEAMANATAAGRVRVLNLSSRKVVEGQAESADRVRVGM